MRVRLFFFIVNALELYMKVIVRRGKSLLLLAGVKLTIPSKAMEQHALPPLLDPIRAIFAHVGWLSKSQPEGRRMFREFEKLVRDVSRLESGSYTFRYPVNKKNQASASHQFGFNVLEFAEQVEETIRFLDGAAGRAGRRMGPSIRSVCRSEAWVALRVRRKRVCFSRFDSKPGESQRTKNA